MPSTLEAPVLQVDANVIHKVDTSNPQNLFNMWTVFARCAGSVAQGRRLENLSWRLWTRETFCVEAASSLSSDDFLTPTSSHSPRLPIPRRSRSSADELPQLSGSVESLADEETVEFSGELGLDISRPHIRRQDSCGSSRSRGRERHITSDDLEKMVVSIVQEKPLKSILPEIPPLSSGHLATVSQPTEQTEQPTTVEEPAAEAATPETDSDASSHNLCEMADETPAPSSVSPETETTKVATEIPLAHSPKSTTVIRGFSPSQIPIHVPQIVTASPLGEVVCQPIEEEDAIPEPTSAPAAQPVPSKKATFALGGSSSCDDSMSDPSQSLEMHKSPLSQMAMAKRKSGILSNVASSSAMKKLHPEEDSSLKSAMHSSRNLGAQKKQTSFSNQVMTRTIPAPSVFADDSESEDIDESAIDDDDDDSSDWEDSNEESGRSSMVDDKTLFQRVDSKVHLPKRHSLITLMLQKSEREVKNGLTTSQSTMALSRPRVARQPPSLVASPNDSDDAALTMRQRGRPQSTLRPINEIPRSAAQPIMATAPGGQYQAAYSPRTNRRNMLSTELTESLRRHLLWERSQKSSTANAVLKRRHTSHDVANLKQYPEAPHMNKDNDANVGSWDQYLNRDAFNGYHAKGW